MAMNRLFIFLLFIGFQSMVIGQTMVFVSLEGTVQDFDGGQKLIGATVNVIQNGVSISRVISDDKGKYYVSAKVNPTQLIAVVVANTGYMTKKISFDLKTLVPKSTSQDALKLATNLPLHVYQIRPNVDLAFTKENYAEKFVWDQTAYKLVADEQVKTEMDTKVSGLYKIAADNQKTAAYVSAADLAVSQKEFDKAVSYYDSALVVSPLDAGILQKKKSVETIIQINANEAKRKKAFEEFKAEGDVAFNAKNWTEAERNYKLADQQIPKDPYILDKLAKTTAFINDEKKNATNKQEYDKAMQAALVLVNSKKYPEAIAKYNEALKLQPAQKDLVEAEITKVKNIQKDIETEKEVKKLLKQAADLYTQKKYDPSIDMYKKADAEIALFKKQSLIDQYSKELQTGMKKVTDWKNSQDQVYKDQLQKANDNFLKGPSGYPKAKEILNSTPMKSRSTEPSVIELNDKIAKMEQYYKDRKVAYATVKSKNNEQALKELKAVQTNAALQTAYLPATELPQLQKTIDSLQAFSVVKVTTVEPVKTEKEDVAKGKQLKAPGERVNGNPDQAFNDLSQSVNDSKERPQEQMQEIKNVFDYQNHFSKTVDDINKGLTDQEMQTFKSEGTIIERKNELERDQRQVNLSKEVQKNEVAVSDRDKAQVVIQEQNAVKIDGLKTSKELADARDKTDADKRMENEMSRTNVISNQDELRGRNLSIQEQNALTAQEKMNTSLENVVSSRQEAGVKNQEQQQLQIQKIADSKVTLKNTPNNLVDEDGVLFPKNAMTERTYTLKNAQNHVTTVIVRRVVVDKNGYGVVFEQTTNERGVNSFTRDGEVITDYIWNNESTGANVIEK